MRINNDDNAEKAAKVEKYLVEHTRAAQQACIDALRKRNCAPHFFPYIMAVVTNTALHATAAVFGNKSSEKELILTMTSDLLEKTLEELKKIKEAGN